MTPIFQSIPGMTSVCAAVTLVTSQEATVSVRILMDQSFGASLAPTGPGRVPSASSSAPAPVQVTRRLPCCPRITSILISIIDTNNSPGIGRQMDNDEQVTPCSDGSYCCGDGSLGSSCCNQGRGVFVRDGTTQAANPTSTPASSSSLQSPSGSPTTTGVPAGPTRTTASSLAPATSSPRSNVNAGAIAGIVIGGLAGIVLLLGAVWFLCFRRRKAKKAARNDITQRQGYPPSSEVWGWPYGDHTKTEPQEAQGSYTGQYKRSELQAGPVSWTAGKSELDTQQILPPNATQLR